MKNNRLDKGCRIGSSLANVVRLRVVLSFALLAFLLCSGTVCQAQEKRLTLKLDNVTLEQFFDAVKVQSGLSFSVESTAINMSARVTANYTDQPIDVVLKNVLWKQNLTYEIKDNHIVIYIIHNPNKTTAQAGNLTITGRVVDAQGLPVIGAGIIIDGTTRGTTSDVNGRFSILVPSAESLLNVSFIGYDPQIIALAGRNTVEIVMAESAIAMEELVVVGYGTQIRRNVATAITSVGADKLADIPVTNATQALVGQVSGLSLQQQSGAPGEAPIVRIRGNGSITSGNGPLYVIDGYPTNDASLFNAISAADIESIDIMKDAASAAIYGSRAGNGVILVTTKRGKKDHTTFNFDATVGVDQVMQKYPMMNADEFVEMAKEGLAYNNKSIPDFLNDPSRWTRTDWQDVIFRPALYQNYHLSAMGGTDKVQFSVSGGYINQEGILETTFMKRYNLRASIDAQLTKRLKIGATLQPSYTQRRVQNTSGGNTSSGVDGIIAEALTMPPVLPVWRDNGDYFVIFQDPEMSGIFNQELSNPLNKLHGIKDDFSTFRQTASTYIEYEPIKGLKFRSSVNLGYVNEEEEFYTEAFIAKGNGHTGNISTPNLANIRARRRNATNTNLYWSNIATYDLNINKKHDFNFLVGYDAATQNDFYTQVEPRTDKDNPVAFDNTTIKNVQGAINTKGSSEKKSYLFDAVFARVSYNYMSKYMLSASIRRDRSSRFGPDNRAGYFPSVAGGWNIKEEPFMESVKAISTLKFRASYGETGNDQLSGYYPWLTSMSPEYYNFGTTDSRLVGYKPGGFSNQNLGWEKNKQFDLGLDIAFLNNRLALVVDLYDRRSNTILSADIPAINGKATTIMQNVGKIQNKGLEIAINSTNIDGEFQWKSNFNISFNRNKIMSLNEGQSALSVSGAVRNYVGRPFGDIYMYILDGTFNNEADLKKYAKLGSQGIGDLKFKDVSGPKGVPDGVINSTYDQVRVGNYQPDFTFGFSNTFTYKNFDLNILLDGQVGGEVYRSQELAVSLSRWLENGSKESIGRWRSESDPGNGRYHRAGTTNISSNISANTRYLYDADFLRIRNITLGYTLPNKLAKKLSVQNARIFLTTQNLHIFSNYGGFNNPQGSTTGDKSTNNGVESGSYPLARNISFGLNLTF